MDTAQFNFVVEEVVNLTADVQEPYRVAAFQAALTARLLGMQVLVQSSTGGASLAGTDIPVMSLLGQSRTFEEYAIQLPKRASHVDRFVAIAYWLLKSGTETFNVQESLEYYTRAHWLKPNNPQDIANKCQGRGYFSATGKEKNGSKEWKLTKTGFRYAESLTNEEAATGE